ncbi:MAG: EAL domain-containing protein, partial [Pseudomonadota bacterium]
LNPRDLDVMRAFANLSAEQINEKILQRDAEAAQRARLRDVIAKQSFEIAYQPIFNLETGHPAGFEALTRFAGTPYRPPNLWFDEAREAGVQSELEIAVIEVALGALAHLPSNLYVSVNASPATVETGALPAPFRKAGPERILLEVTEHAAVGDYDALLRELSAIRVLGTRFAVDDAGAGYSGLQHIIQLRPDIIKLDISLTAGIHQDIARRSLAAALVAFATETNAHIVAEGIEERAEFETLRKLGITYGQGYLLGRPQPLSDARKLTRPEAYRKRA